MPNNPKFKLQCHLLGETFPDKFLVVFAFDKADVGGPSQKADVICNPSNEAEMNALHTILNGANSAPYGGAIRRFRTAIKVALAPGSFLSYDARRALESALEGRDPS